MRADLVRVLGSGPRAYDAVHETDARPHHNSNPEFDFS